jgi:hypothetical protein
LPFGTTNIKKEREKGPKYERKERKRKDRGIKFVELYT